MDTRMAAWAFVALILVNGVQAQTPPTSDLPASEPGPFYHHASTIEQGWLDGWGNVVRSYGLADYNHSLAARHWQMAKEHALRNSVLAVDVRFERKLHNRNYRKLTARPPITLDRAVQNSRDRLPSRLSADEFVAEYGHIRWPEGLMSAEFTPCRAQVEALFRERTSKSSGTGSANQQQICRAVAALEKQVSRRVREIDTAAYLAARRFLKSLKYEAYFAVQRNTALAHLDTRITQDSLRPQD